MGSDGRMLVHPIYLIIGLISIAVLFWLITRSNRNFGNARRWKDLARENYHLRHVVAELSMERHDPSRRR